GPRERGADSVARLEERLDEQLRRLTSTSNAGVSALWRVAALLAFAALAVTLYFNTQTSAMSRTLVNALQNQAVDEQARELARQLAGFELRAQDRVALAARDGAAGDAWVYVDRANQRLVVVGMGISTELHILPVRGGDDAGNARVLDRVACNGAFAKVYPLPAEFSSPGAHIELVDHENAVRYAGA
ncbi:MAG: hypothetical protein ACO3IB_04550, partial [Phycisphaerales bacterium]